MSSTQNPSSHSHHPTSQHSLTKKSVSHSDVYSNEDLLSPGGQTSWRRINHQNEEQSDPSARLSFVTAHSHSTASLLNSTTSESSRILHQPQIKSSSLSTSRAQSVSPNQSIIALLNDLSNPSTHWSQKLTSLQKLHAVVPLVVHASNTETPQERDGPNGREKKHSRRRQSVLEHSEDGGDQSGDADTQITDDSLSPARTTVSPNHAAKLMMLLSGLLSDLRCSLVKESCELMENMINNNLSNLKLWDILPLRKLLQLHGSPLSAMKHASEKTLRAILDYWKDSGLLEEMTLKQRKAFVMPFLEFAEKWMRSARVATEFEISNKRMALEYLEETFIWQGGGEEEYRARLLSVLEKYSNDKSIKVGEYARKLLERFERGEVERGKREQGGEQDSMTLDQDSTDSPLTNSAGLDKLLESNQSPLISQLSKTLGIPSTDQVIESESETDSDIKSREESIQIFKPKSNSSGTQDQTHAQNPSSQLYTKQDLIQARRDGMKQTQSEVAVLVAHNQQIESDLANHKLIEEQMTQTMTILDEQLDLQKKKYNQLLDDYHKQKTLLKELQQLVDTMQNDESSHSQTRVEQLESALELEIKKRNEMKVAANEKLEVANQNVQRIHQEHVRNVKRLKELEDELKQKVGEFDESEKEKKRTVEELQSVRGERDELQQKIEELQSIRRERDDLQQKVAELQGVRVERDALQQKVQEFARSQEEKNNLQQKVGELQNLHKQLTRDNKDLTRRTRELELQLLEVSSKPSAVEVVTSPVDDNCVKEMMGSSTTTSASTDTTSKNHTLERKIEQLKEENDKKDEQNRELLKMLHEAVKRLEKAEQRSGGQETYGQ